MEYQKIINYLDNATNKPSKFIEINNDIRGAYSPNE